ncbi:MAG TPA: hypothetical protein VKT25_00495 [Ktedonobacteraceae bacterium]|nr:hypothetical protein [Ktedonobacteraceae bacterium]
MASLYHVEGAHQPCTSGCPPSIQFAVPVIWLAASETKGHQLRDIL